MQSAPMPTTSTSSKACMPWPNCCNGRAAEDRAMKRPPRANGTGPEWAGRARNTAAATRLNNRYPPRCNSDGSGQVLADLRGRDTWGPLGGRSHLGSGNRGFMLEIPSSLIGVGGLLAGDGTKAALVQMRGRECGNGRAGKSGCGGIAERKGATGTTQDGFQVHVEMVALLRGNQRGRNDGWDEGSGRGDQGKQGRSGVDSGLRCAVCSDGIRSAIRPGARRAYPGWSSGRTHMTRCADCTHLSKPGKVDVGYCAGRNDLPLAYGTHHPLRKLPADRGASCDRFKERG